MRSASPPYDDRVARLHPTGRGTGEGVEGDVGQEHDLLVGQILGISATIAWAHGNERARYRWVSDRFGKGVATLPNDD